MFKGLITKAVKDMVVDPIMNPKAPQEGESPAAEPPADQARSNFDPERFDQPHSAGGRFDPDSFDEQPRPQKSAPVNPVSPGTALDPAEARDLMVSTWDIELPFFPGEGTQCGRTCDCTWAIERSFSADFGAECLFATWIPGNRCDSCPDCLERAADWAHTFVRPAAD